MSKRILIRITNDNPLIKTITNWDKNRPPDPVRVEDIVRDMKVRNANWVDGFILLWKKNESELLCYDGIHRIEASKKIDHEVEILIQIMEDVPESIIMEEFLRINKSVSISRLYSKAEQELTLKTTIEQLVKQYQEKYQTFFKPTRHPRIPHHNRDIWMEELYESTECHPERRNWKLERWCEYINQVSDEHKKAYELKLIRLTKKQAEKCEAHDFWLFAKKK